MKIPSAKPSVHCMSNPVVALSGCPGSRKEVWFVMRHLSSEPTGISVMERILYAVFSYENLRQGLGTPFLLLTQKP
jgi:hypothetical protein